MVEITRYVCFRNDKSLTNPGHLISPDIQKWFSTRGPRSPDHQRGSNYRYSVNNVIFINFEGNRADRI